MSGNEERGGKETANPFSDVLMLFESEREAGRAEGRAEERKRYEELVDALCSKSWLGRTDHIQVLALAHRMRSLQKVVVSKEPLTPAPTQGKNK